MPEIIDLVDTASEDELDLLSPASSTAVGSGSATPTKRLASTPSSTTRVLRSRISRTVITVSQPSKKTAIKRKRPAAEDVVVATAVKKLKTEHRKQVGCYAKYINLASTLAPSEHCRYSQAKACYRSSSSAVVSRPPRYLRPSPPFEKRVSSETQERNFWIWYVCTFP